MLRKLQLPLPKGKGRKNISHQLRKCLNEGNDNGSICSHSPNNFWSFSTKQATTSFCLSLMDTVNL